MPSFDIYYRTQDGMLLENFSVQCGTPMQAKIIAHAMKLRPFAEIAVWQDEALIYECPERAIVEAESPSAA